MAASLSIFLLDALGQFPDGPAAPAAREQLEALVAARQTPWIVTELPAAARDLVKAWMEREQLPWVGCYPIYRDDRFPSGMTKIRGYLVPWFRDLLGACVGQEVSCFVDSLETAAELSEVAGSSGVVVTFHLVTEHVIYRVES